VLGSNREWVPSETRGQPPSSSPSLPSVTFSLSFFFLLSEAESRQGSQYGSLRFKKRGEGGTGEAKYVFFFFLLKVFFFSVCYSVVGLDSKGAPVGRGDGGMKTCASCFRPFLPPLFFTPWNFFFFFFPLVLLCSRGQGSWVRGLKEGQDSSYSFLFSYLSSCGPFFPLGGRRPQVGKRTYFGRQANGKPAPLFSSPPLFFLAFFFFSPTHTGLHPNRGESEVKEGSSSWVGRQGGPLLSFFSPLDFLDDTGLISYFFFFLGSSSSFFFPSFFAIFPRLRSCPRVFLHEYPSLFPLPPPFPFPCCSFPRRKLGGGGGGDFFSPWSRGGTKSAD